MVKHPWSARWREVKLYGFRTEIAASPKRASFPANQSCNDVDTHRDNRGVEEKGKHTMK
jgi:hypothetical protein